jgi:hypothetical protein
MADCWNPETQEILLSAAVIPKAEIVIQSHSGSTEDSPIRTHNPRRVATRRLSSSLALPETEFFFDARFETDLNISHILTNVAAGVIAAREVFSPISIVLRSRASTMAQEACRCLGFRVICTDKNVRGNMIDAPPGNSAAYEGWYRTLFGDLEFPGYDPNTPERVFLSRREGRTLSNEAEVIGVLAPLGFKTVYFEELSIAQQWSIGRNTRVIAGIHGAALSSLLFDRHQPKVLELFHPGYVVRRHMTNAIGGSWCGVSGQIPADLIRELDQKQDARHFAQAPIRIDPGSLRRGLEHLNVT